MVSAFSNHQKTPEKQKNLSKVVTISGWNYPLAGLCQVL